MFISIITWVIFNLLGASLEKSRGRSMVEVMKSRETKDVDVPKLQNFTKGNQEKPMKFDNDSLGGNGSSGDQSDIKSDLWWLKLPYALVHHLNL